MWFFSFRLFGMTLAAYLIRWIFSAVYFYIVPYKLWWDREEVGESLLYELFFQTWYSWESVY